MEVTELPLPPTLRTKLQAAGYLTLDCNVSPVQLAQDIEITPKEALDILKLVPRSNVVGWSSTGEISIVGAANAWDILQDEKARMRISTSCKELDDILGGGIASKEVTEISGVPGVGKTQIGIQLCINVQIPPELDGIGGHAVYIDTEGSFMVERVIQMAESCIVELEGKAAAANPQEDVKQMKEKLQLNNFLSHIHYYRVHSATEQVALVNTMEKFLSEHRQVRLVVLDSVAFQVRQGFSDMGARTRLLSSMAQTLTSLADKHELAIVIINQFTQKITDEGSRMVPALGEGWAHSTTNRLLLYWSGRQRHALLLKSSYLPRRVATYVVTQRGVRSAAGDSQEQ